MIDRGTARRFLATAYQSDDWIAVLVKSYETGRVAQRVAPVALVMSPTCQAWIDRENGAAVRDFPTPSPIRRHPLQARPSPATRVATDAVARARCYLAALPPAITGQHGDQQTFRVCCRLVRGFALSDGEALAVLIEWNARCAPPWSERALMDKLCHARRYGREPIGGLLEIQR